MSGVMYKKEENNRNNRLIIEDASIIFRNFSGRETKYNKEGNRNFCVFIDDENVADQLTEDGWNVRILAARDDSEPARHYLPVAVNYSVKPPALYLETRKKQTRLSEDTVGQLDYADIIKADIVLNPRYWVDDRTGAEHVKAYIRSGHFTIEEDEFADKYDRDEAPGDDD